MANSKRSTALTVLALIAGLMVLRLMHLDLPTVALRLMERLHIEPGSGLGKQILHRLLRVKKDAAVLSQDRLVLKDGNRPPGTLDRIQRIAHGLSGAGGIYGFAEISDAAAALEDAVIAELADFGASDQTDLALDDLLIHARNCGNPAGQTAGSLQQN